MKTSSLNHVSQQHFKIGFGRYNCFESERKLKKKKTFCEGGILISKLKTTRSLTLNFI